jgi:hypothetical protein
MIGVVGNAIHGADFATLRRIEVPDALGAFVGIDDVDFIALRNRVVWALGLANIAVDAFIGDHQGHDFFLWTFSEISVAVLNLRDKSLLNQ